MKKLLLTMTLFAVCTSANAVVIDGYDFDDPATIEKLSNLSRSEVDALSPDVRRAYFKRTSELHSGGIVEKPGVGSGSFLFVDSTESLTASMFVRDFNMLDRTLKISPKILRGNPVSVETATTAMKKLNANAAVFVVDNPALPRLITASEEGWAIVNIGKLKVDNPSKEVFEKRITVEAIRGLAQIFGSGNAGMSMSAITSLKDIDDLQHPGFPPSALKMCQIQMKKLGFEPKVVASYRVACKQGWAPAPTNEVQQVIWEQMHAKPTEPMKIKFDPAKGE